MNKMFENAISPCIQVILVIGQLLNARNHYLQSIILLNHYNDSVTYSFIQPIYPVHGVWDVSLSKHINFFLL